MTDKNISDIINITDKKVSVNNGYIEKERKKEMKTMTNLRVSQEKVQLKMAELCMNPYELCSNAGISYATYRKIMREGGCKIATLGKLAKALNVGVTEIIEN